MFYSILTPILTAQWPVLGRLLSAVYNIQLLDPHCNVTLKKDTFSLFKQLCIIRSCRSCTGYVYC